MVKEFVERWDKNKDKLEEHIKTHIMGEYDDYGDLVKLLFDIVINPPINTYNNAQFDTKNIEELDDGDYQGTLVFILHKDLYQPSVGDYVYTSVGYGSCCGCDTLQAIHMYDRDKLPSEEQVKDYMLLCLHLLQNCHYMGGED